MGADVGVFWADSTGFKHAQWDNKYQPTTNILPITPSPFRITIPFVTPKQALGICSFEKRFFGVEESLITLYTSKHIVFKYFKVQEGMKETKYRHFA